MRRHRDTGWIPGSGRSPGGGRGNPLQYSCLESPTDRGAGWAIIHRVAKSWPNWSDWAHTQWRKFKKLYAVHCCTSWTVCRYQCPLIGLFSLRRRGTRPTSRRRSFYGVAAHRDAWLWLPFCSGPSASQEQTCHRPLATAQKLEACLLCTDALLMLTHSFTE